MQSKPVHLFSCTLVLSTLVAFHTMAQQPKYTPPVNHEPTETAYGNRHGNYTFKLFTAPDNAFGYDIFRNGKPVFHQFVLTTITNEGKRSFATKPQAEKAAMMAIEKIKKGMPPSLSEEEIRKITTQ